MIGRLKVKNFYLKLVRMKEKINVIKSSFPLKGYFITMEFVEHTALEFFHLITHSIHLLHGPVRSA